MSDLLDLLAEMDAPHRDCGHLIPMDNHAHAEKCLNLTCPHCGIVERNAYALVLEHGAFDERHIEQFGTCWPQRWMFERVASCISCHWPTFGVWPCRNENCAEGCYASHPGSPCPTEVARHV
ncbi:MAG: hypothetical protein ACTH8F_12490 [Microbacterium sp.]|uniref:hypothetical protein n=1 Tax=Microbacterium sp. TaxID=51671 RepID=UPI003F949A03